MRGGGGRQGDGLLAGWLAGWASIWWLVPVRGCVSFSVRVISTAQPLTPPLLTASP